MHRWLKRIGLLLTSLLGAAPAARAAPPPDPGPSPTESSTPMTRLFREISEDETLRARFAADPVGVMRERGLDPVPFQLSRPLDATRVERVLRDFADPLASPAYAPRPPQDVAWGPSVAVYGPPPMPEPTPPRHEAKPPPPEPPDHPPVAVYGPPPTPPPTPPDRK